MWPSGLNKTTGLAIELLDNDNDNDETCESRTIELGYSKDNYWTVIVPRKTDGCQDATVTEALGIIWKYYELYDDARVVITIHSNTKVSVNLLCYNSDDESDGTTVEFTVWDDYEDLPVYELR